jgi:hypothetical protein
MSEEDDDLDIDDQAQLLMFIEKCSDTSLLLAKIMPIIELHPNDGKGTIKLKIYLKALSDSVMKLSNDFRSLIKYMNVMKELDFDNDDAPKFETVPADGLFI